MGVNLMYSPLETIFEATMEREGRTITAYTSGSKFQAFMRRNDDGNNYEDRITLFYSVTAPVIQGSLVSYGNKIYILANKETEENHCYYKSSALACNGIVSLNDGSIVGIPCYASSMKNGLVEQNSVMSIIDGSMEFITESNSVSRQLNIGKTFNEFGRTWKIDNVYYKDGILHVIAKVNIDEKPVNSLKVVIDGLNQEMYNVGDAVKLTAMPYINNSITNGTVTWESTNPEVGAIDNEGNVTFCSEGTVAFKAYWVEQNIFGITDGVGVGVPDIYTATLSTAQDNVKIGFYRTLTAKVTNKNGNEVEGIWEFTVDFKYPQYLEYSIDGNKIKIVIPDKNATEITGGEITVTAFDKMHNVSAMRKLTVIGSW